MFNAKLQQVVNNSKFSDVVIGIDASNLLQGGGITHLVELLSATNQYSCGIRKVILWGSKQTLDQVQNKAWLVKITPSYLNHGLLHRLYWQKFKLSYSAELNNCDLLFVPGGSYYGSFRPVVTMSQNMLPFERKELKRFGLSLTTIRLLLLRWVQSRSFRASDGVIFISEYARSHITNIIGKTDTLTSVVPHGVSSRFRVKPRAQKPISEYSLLNPYRIIYVSTIDFYKHQWNVVEAVSMLRRMDVPIRLDFIGQANPYALMRLKKTLALLDPDNSWAYYHGKIPYGDLHHIYIQSDLGIFASSCENMPNILVEKMASGLPIACSSYGPMPEVLGDAGVYFDPENPIDIEKALWSLISSSSFRTIKARECFLK